MRTDYTDVFRDSAAVDKYADEVYANGTFSSVVSERQRQWLRGFITEAFDDAPEHHDFACGTGRVARMLDGLVRTSHGYDTSEAMLAKAHALGTPGQLHVIDEDGPLPTSDSRPTLVTMFRLLLNVSDAVRDRALDFAAGMLPDADSGLLVCENHGNARSLRHLRKALGPGETDWFNELSRAEVERLFDRHGFELVTTQGFSLLTQGFYRHAPLKWVAPSLDGLLARTRLGTAFATDVLYVARRRR
ncbi:methyltransferase domain-containing protein [Stackebrandtia nassauensis]|uniref:Methyltransferase type 11 n=1 Tax=Stackebrandtia nassauensis (strain DSM 44728 / CIP 108903 / NRRL B-16338 / NBRC 102104 / LLR-40K-21) TaxID=446470 RepID=D3Q946_STANL|nr:methyltransferase domain-containing protein [Stackebrandtia nassauensis]ADD40655.1 hypothetical protein Snas_0944 [Stackebrandtia nassauensis DSM 44728]